MPTPPPPSSGEPEPSPGSFAARLNAKSGDGVDPEVSLGGAPEAESSASATSEFVRRLSEHSLKHSRYAPEGEVARGGMGVILRVWDADLRRHLAMKVILGRGESAESGGTPQIDPKQLARFLEQAQVTGQLDHPGIVPVHELGLDSQGRVFFTMKLVKGRDLKHVFDLVFDEKEGWNETPPTRRTPPDAACHADTRAPCYARHRTPWRSSGSTDGHMQLLTLQNLTHFEHSFSG